MNLAYTQAQTHAQTVSKLLCNQLKTRLFTPALPSSPLSTTASRRERKRGEGEGVDKPAQDLLDKQQSSQRRRQPPVIHFKSVILLQTRQGK